MKLRIRNELINNNIKKNDKNCNVLIYDSIFNNHYLSYVKIIYILRKFLSS